MSLSLRAVLPGSSPMAAWGGVADLRQSLLSAPSHIVAALVGAA